ncbi:MAG: hypothetical protein Kow00124_14710 [Anaerolineae bacterium]
MFNPTLDTRLVIDRRDYHFTPHPVVPTIVWGQEGRHAIVYRIQSNGDAYALKVFRPAFQHPGLIEAAQTLSWYHDLPGMSVCDQIVLTRETHAELIARYEDLNYAMMMPWIEGQTWFDYLQTRERVTLDQSRALAENTAWVLYALELNQIAHCDLSSGNVIVDPSLELVHLIDVEDLYSPWLEPPPFVPAGTVGYAHRSVRETGQWSPLGDRFSGAVLIAEMLAWANPEVRKRAWGESYFSPEEIHQDSERYRVLRDTLRLYNPGFAEAFEQAWRSRSLDQCPPLKTWYDLLDALPREPVAEWAPIDPRKFQEETPRPGSVAVPAVAGPAGAARTGQAGSVKGLLNRLAISLGIGCNVAVVIAALVTFVCCFLTVAIISSQQ